MKSSGSILNDKHFQLLSFLITSARGCIDEPFIYGPLRLLDGAYRLLSIMKDEGKVDEDLEELQNDIEECIDILMYDEKEFVKMLNDLSQKLGEIIKKKS